MNTMGIRVKPGEVTFAVYDTEAAAVVNVEIIKIPKALPTPDALKYVRNNILDVIREFSIARAGLRVTESSAQSKNVERIEIEGVIQEAFASSCLQGYYIGQISNISRRVGFARDQFKRFVSNEIPYEPVENWDKLKPEAREAIFAALGAQHA
ncbi:hypothetical protein CSC74_09610 [Pseudoxanthomonas yeongjuensis]|uniref:hypothetical protein n=1 Tax=Pseudoxanthomonas yeongjuensis TaxID=377616 RepID=UPI001391CE6B|nr:hypothetical protein [Pseudoxanthomonas yeongjuensis]KAF1717098.1 hypothetical protein CSC74_09610 [Pseudoxanthomonas yeongjuensis]